MVCGYKGSNVQEIKTRNCGDSTGTFDDQERMNEGLMLSVWLARRPLVVVERSFRDREIVEWSVKMDGHFARWEH